MATTGQNYQPQDGNDTSSGAHIHTYIPRADGSILVGGIAYIPQVAPTATVTAIPVTTSAPVVVQPAVQPPYPYFLNHYLLYPYTASVSFAPRHTKSYISLLSANEFSPLGPTTTNDHPPTSIYSTPTTHLPIRGPGALLSTPNPNPISTTELPVGRMGGPTLQHPTTALQHHRLHPERDTNAKHGYRAEPGLHQEAGDETR